MIGLNLKVCVGNDNAFKARDMLRGKMKSPQKSEGVRCVQCSAGEEQIFIIILKGCYHMSHCFVGRSRLGYTCLTYHMCKRIIYIYIYTGCPRRNVPDFERVSLMLKYTDITQNTCIQS